MKVKLKVTKTTKRNLKIKAIENKMTRKDYVKQLFIDHIEGHEDLWGDKINGYKESYEKKSLALNELLQYQLKNKEATRNENVEALRDFYKKNNIHMYNLPKNSIYENIIFRLTEEQYFALHILADLKNMALENYAEDLVKSFE
jgi:hypothetical protein